MDHGPNIILITVSLNYSKSIEIVIEPSDGAVGQSYHRPIVPPYYIEDCRIFNTI